METCPNCKTRTLYRSGGFGVIAPHRTCDKCKCLWWDGDPLTEKSAEQSMHLTAFGVQQPAFYPLQLLLFAEESSATNGGG